MKVFNSLFLCAVFLVSVKGGVLRNDNDTFKLDIVHYNDFHARFEETSVTDPICKTNDAKCVGGFARLVFAIKRILKQKPDAVLLNAGDDFQGTYWYTLMKHKVMSTFINMLPNDAHTIGNHEFDDGMAGLVPYLKALKDPVLVANMNITLEPSLQGLYKPHVVLERKGRKIGIIGVTTPETKKLSNPQGVTFLDPIPVVQREAKLLTEQGVDIIIVLSHCGLSVDKAMAKAAGENVDIIVGGHSHSLLWNGTAPSNETVAGGYPEFEEAANRPGHKVLVVTASAYSKYLGNIGVEFDEHGEVVSFEAEPIFLDRNVPEDPEIKTLMKPYMDKIHDTVNEIVGVTSDVLPLQICEMGECALGDIVADAFLTTAKRQAPSNLTAFSIVFKHFMRTYINKGDITRGDVINVLPFSNQIIAYKIQGKHVKQAMELVLKSDFRRKGGMPQVSGLKLAINVSNGEIVSALVKDGNEWKSMEDEKEYQCIMPRFMKDQSEPLKTNAKNVNVVGTDWEILTNYIMKIFRITPTLDGRLTVLS